MRKHIAVVAMHVLLCAGCGGHPPQRLAPKPEVATNPLPAEQPFAAPIPRDVTYEIISQDIMPDIKRGLVIRLNKKVSKDVLKSLAMELKNSDSRNYQRTFIVYYLPEMEINAACWATTHFNPELEVRILGLAADEEQTLRQTPKDPSREFIGNWLDDTPFVGKRLTIFRQAGKLFMEATYKDGASSPIELLESRSQLGQRFDKVGGSVGGDHWVIDAKGDLQLCDEEGVIAIAKKIQ